jgi:hypothetical protein
VTAGSGAGGPRPGDGGSPAGRPETGRPRRVTVMHPRTRAPRGGSGYRPDAGTPHAGDLDDAYIRSLMRVQLRGGLLVCLFLALTLGALPLLFALAPKVGTVRVLGLDLPWLLLGVLVYPVLLLAAWLYVRRAERAERQFADVVGDR